MVEAGAFSHPCEGEAVCKLTNEKVRHRPEGSPPLRAVGSGV